MLGPQFPAIPHSNYVVAPKCAWLLREMQIVEIEVDSMSYALYSFEQALCKCPFESKRRQIISRWCNWLMDRRHLNGKVSGNQLGLPETNLGASGKPGSDIWTEGARKSFWVSANHLGSTWGPRKPSLDSKPSGNHTVNSAEINSIHNFIKNIVINSLLA